MNQSFSSLDERGGVRITDPIERRRYDLHTPVDVEPTPISTERFAFPIDEAVSIETGSITLPQVVAAYIRDGDGEMTAEAEHYADVDLPAGEYSIELCAPIKLYVRVDGPLSVSGDTTEMTFGFDGPTEVLIGSRSHHDHPAGTITTTEDPIDVMSAVSYLGSALKTTTCERSYPTLRGHPPTIEIGSELDVPADLERPATGIRLELPTDLASVFVAAPLAYYLGADVVPGPVPKIITDQGYEHVLDGPDGFEADVERVLKQVFFLDCLTRTEGLYQVDLHEREVVSPLLDLDFAALYDRPLADQLEAYLGVSFALIEDHLPQWKLTTHIVPEPDNVEMLPFAVNDLAVIKTPGEREPSSSSLGPQAGAVDDFMRSGVKRSLRAGAPTRSTTEAKPETPPVVHLDETNSLEQAWVGDDVPLGASKATVTAFHNKLAREATEGEITITVICNDEEMLTEHDDVADVYGNREELPFDVRLYRDLSVERLRLVLESETDFLHYIGHIDEHGFECTDGMLDAGKLDTIGVDTFFLNACRSYHQGMALIDGGAIAGVVTVADILDSGALRIGRAMARLLNRGFPMRAALNIASGQSIIGNQYLVVGYGNIDIAQAESGTPAVFELDKANRSLRVDFKTYPTSHRSIGTTIMPHIRSNETHFLTSGNLKPFNVSGDELQRLFDTEVVPLYVDGKLAWSDTFDPSDI